MAKQALSTVFKNSKYLVIIENDEDIKAIKAKITSKNLELVFVKKSEIKRNVSFTSMIISHTFNGILLETDLDSKQYETLMYYTKNNMAYPKQILEELNQ